MTRHVRTPPNLLKGNLRALGVLDATPESNGGRFTRSWRMAFMHFPHPKVVDAAALSPYGLSEPSELRLLRKVRELLDEFGKRTAAGELAVTHKENSIGMLDCC